MTIVTLDKAQAELPDLIKRALDGEEIVIQSDGREVRLEAAKSASYRGRGALKGQMHIGPGFFEPLPEAECGICPDEPLK